MKAMLGIVLGAIFGFAGIVSVHAQGTPVSKMDIAGVQIGMTEAEVEAALKTFDSGLELASVMAVFNYSDGVSHTLESPEFLDRVEAKQGNQGVSITVYFSGGPGEDVRVIGVSRSALIMANPPTAAQFMQSLVAKYGQPAGLSSKNQSLPVWEEAGKPSCIRARDYKNEVDINIGTGIGAGLMVNANAEQFLSKRAGSISRGLLPSDLAQCGAYLGYYYLGDPVRNFSAELYDLGAVVATERSRTAWVDQLQAEAVSKRQGQGQVPKF